jgi:hypothetical protein
MPEETADLLAEDFDPRTLVAYQKATARVEAANTVAKAFAKSLGKDGRIADDETMSRAAEVVTLAQDVVKEIKASRLESTEILRQRTDDINGVFNEISNPLDGVVKGLKAKIAERNKEIEEQAAEVQAKLEAEAAKAQEAEDEAAAEEGREAVEIQAPEVVPPPTTVKTSTSRVSGNKTRKYEVTDFAKLPDEFKKEDKGALNAAAKGGRDNVPGVRFYYENTTAVTKR